MGVQTDVKSQRLAATAAMTNTERLRIKGVYIVHGGTAGSVIIREGGASGTVLVQFDTVASAVVATDVILPGEGLLSAGATHVTITNAASIVIFYG